MRPECGHPRCSSKVRRSASRSRTVPAKLPWRARLRAASSTRSPMTSRLRNAFLDQGVIDHTLLGDVRATRRCRHAPRL